MFAQELSLQSRRLSVPTALHLAGFTWWDGQPVIRSSPSRCPAPFFRSPPELPDAEVNSFQDWAVHPESLGLSPSLPECPQPLYAYSAARHTEALLGTHAPGAAPSQWGWWPWVHSSASPTRTPGEMTLSCVPHGFSGGAPCNGAPVPGAGISSLTHAWWLSSLPWLTPRSPSLELPRVTSQINSVHQALCSGSFQGELT